MALVEPRQGFGSLERSLWEDFSLGRRMGLSDLGTYNAASRLPSGAPSDHAVYPARAFDLGFFPPLGEGHPIARTFFEAMVGRPEVGYVILGRTIWSAARGRHTYTAGGHMGHVHVSGAQGAAVPLPDRRSPASSSTALSTAELSALWINAGGNPRQAAMAAAVASLESGGRPRARALTNREDSRGLWQINVRAHPQWALRDLYNPRVNAQAAIAISRNGTDWSPWTTAAEARANVAGLPFLGRPSVTRPGGVGDVAGAIGGAAGDVLGGVLGIFKPLWAWGEALVAFVTFVVNPLNWLRAVEVVFGFTLLLSALAILVLEFSRAGSGAGRAAGVAAMPALRAGAALRRGAAG